MSAFLKGERSLVSLMVVMLLFLAAMLLLLEESALGVQR